jgi:hypothetical protein
MSQNVASQNEAFLHEENKKINDDRCVELNGHSCQAFITDDGVVLDLEDCCKMTICETVRILNTFIVNYQSHY